MKTIDLSRYRGIGNTPDDWDCHWITCPHGHRYHASEGVCAACDGLEEHRPDCEERRVGYFVKKSRRV